MTGIIGCSRRPASWPSGGPVRPGWRSTAIIHAPHWADVVTVLELRLTAVLPCGPGVSLVGNQAATKGQPPAPPPGPTAVELRKFPRETRRLLPLSCPEGGEGWGEEAPMNSPAAEPQGPIRTPLPNPLPVRRGEGEATPRSLSALIQRQWG